MIIIAPFWIRAGHARVLARDDLDFRNSNANRSSGGSYNSGPFIISRFVPSVVAIGGGTSSVSRVHFSHCVCTSASFLLPPPPREARSPFAYIARHWPQFRNLIIILSYRVFVMLLVASENRTLENMKYKAKPYVFTALIPCTFIIGSLYIKTAFFWFLLANW